MSSVTKLNVNLSVLEHPHEEEEQQEKESREEPTILVPNTGSFNHYHVLTTGASVSGISFIILLIVILIVQRFKQKSPKFGLNVKKHINTLRTLALISFVTTFSFLTVFLKQTTFAETKGFLELPLYTDRTLDLDAKILNTNDIAFKKQSIIIMQDSDYGYSLYLHGDSLNLINDTNPEAFIHSISEPGALANNTFGYTLENPTSNPNAVTWHPLHSEDNRDIVIDIDRPVSAGEQIDIYFGVRSSNLEPGTYTANLNYSAVSKTPFIMQNMTSDVCSIMEPGITYSFKDERDDKYYNIAKLNDGNCWMTSDLRTELIVDEESGQSGIKHQDGTTITKITSENTDLNSKAEWSPNTSTLTESNRDKWSTCYDNDACIINRSYKHTKEPTQATEEAEKTESETQEIIEESVSEKTIDESTSDTDFTYYYSWYTATLNSVSYEDTDTNKIKAADSVCPKGWSLPTNKHFEKFLSVYGRDPGVYFEDPVNLNTNGRISEGNLDGQGTGYYWSSEANWEYAYNLAINEEIGLNDSEGFYGLSLRCVSTVTSSNIIFNANTTDSVQNMPTNTKVILSETGELDYTLPSETPTRHGWIFAGWATNPETAPNYESNQNIKIDTANLVLYAIWYKETGMALQAMDENYCQNNIEEGILYAFTDSRDEKTYSVSKYKDGNCWIAQNLDFNLSSETILTPNDTDIIENWTPNKNTSAEDKKEWNYEECMKSGDLSACPQYSFDTGEHSNGNFYNIFAANAGNLGIDEEGNLPKTSKTSICPSGWKIANDTDYINLFGQYGYEVDQKLEINNLPNILSFTDTLTGFYNIKNDDEDGFYPGYVSKIRGEEGSIFQSIPSGITFIKNSSYGYLGANDNDYLLAGGSVRCISRYSHLTISYASNTSDEVENLPSSTTIELTSDDSSFIISNQTPARSDYIFAGWSTTATGAPEYLPGEQYNPISSTVTFYAVWYKKLPDIEIMQNITTEVCSNLTLGIQYALKDARDEKYYSVAKLADGNCWMTSDLKLDLDKSKPLIKENTDLNSSDEWIPNHSTQTEPENYWGNCWSQEACQSHQYSLNHQNNYYYDWFAATAGSGTYNTANQNASDSICPKGWYLPGHSTYTNLLNIYRSTNPYLNLAPVNLSFKGRTEGDYIENRKDAFYWTSSANSPDSAYVLTSYIGDESQVSLRSKYYGLPIRCIVDTKFSATVTFFANDEGTTVFDTINATGFHGSATITLPDGQNYLHKEGYEFVGWSPKENKQDRNNNYYPAGTEISVNDLNVKFYPAWKQFTPKSILGANGNLNFVYDNKVYTAGQTYTDNIGETTIVSVCTGKNNSFTPCNTRSDILSANFDISFKNYYPASTADWFSRDGHLLTITNIENLNMSNVTNMSYMFYETGKDSSSFVVDFSGWNTSKVANMSHMFYGAGYKASSFSLNLSNWNTSSVTNMSYMFDSAGYNAESFSLNLSGWDTSHVTNMSYMFSSAGYHTQSFLLNLSGWDTGNVANMSHMFYHAGHLSPSWSIGDLSDWNTSNVTDMSGMFYYAGENASSFLLDLSNWDTGNVTDMGYMFDEAGHAASSWSIGNLSSWDTSHVTNMTNMFSFAGYNAQPFSLDLSNWDISNTASTNSMFKSTGYNASSFSLNLSGWNTSGVTDMGWMFSAAGHKTSSFYLDLSNWDTSNVTNMEYMFDDAGHTASSWSVGDLSGWDTSHVTSMSGMFNLAGYNASSWSVGNLSSWDTSHVTSMSGMFQSAGYKASSFYIDFFNWNTSNVTNMSYMFSYAGYSASSFSLDLSNWDTSSVTNMRWMFSSAGYNASSWSVGDLSGWDTSHVTNMSDMFSLAGYNASSWSVGDLSGWDTSNVTDMSHMFYATAMKNVSSFSLNLSSWNTGKVTDMSYMFYETGKNASSFSLKLSGWDTSHVTNMSWMFCYTGYNALPFSLDLSDWDTSNVTNMSYMFNNSQVQTVYVSDKWNTDRVTSSNYMFGRSLQNLGLRITGGAGTKWDSSNPAGKTYARIDDPDNGKPGYFTDIKDKPTEAKTSKEKPLGTISKSKKDQTIINIIIITTFIGVVYAIFSFIYKRKTNKK